MSVLTVARTTLLRASRRPSTYAIGALAFLPAIAGGLSGWAGHGVLAAGGPIALRFVGPLMIPALVAAPVGEQFENRTVVYWFTRPFARAWVLVGDALAYGVLALVALGLAGMLLAGMNAIMGQSDLAGLLRVPAAMVLQGFALVSLSVAAGALVPKHPMVSVLALLAFTEGAAAVRPQLAYASLGFHAGALGGMPYAVGESAMAAPSPVVSVLVLLAYAVVPLLIAAQTVNDRDVV
jgi:hypothetical protein